MKKHFIIYLSIFALSTLFTNCKSDKKENTSESIIVAADDSDMNKAIKTAQASFDKFKEAFIENEKSNKYNNFLVKQSFTSKDNQVEHMWIYGLQYDGKQFKGFLANTPIHDMDIQVEDEVIIDPSKISDWTYTEIETGNTHGGFSLKVIRDMMSDEDKAQFDSQHQGVFVDW